jgi:membrane associated rhomboid family serine protease
MIAPEPPAPLESVPFPDGSADAGVYATLEDGFEHSLVVLAMGEACWLIPSEAGHHLRVDATVLPAVRQQLACFDRERIGWPPRPAVDHVPRRAHAPLSPLLWVLAVIAVFWAQEKVPGLTDAGLLDARRVFDLGEWWRPVTALWLHDDIGHLISNVVSGFLVFSAVVGTFGPRAGWRLLAGAAVAGNVAVVTLHYGEGYRSLGASTAIFAGLGLLVGRAVRVMSRSGHPHLWRTMLVPLAAGLAVLGLYGAGGMHTDVLAHATGFGAGLVSAFVATQAKPDSSTHREG